MKRLPRIRHIALGGTISSVSASESGTVSPTLPGSKMVESIPELAEVAKIENCDFPPVASSEITLHQMHLVALEAARALADGCDGVVVSQGTDTLEDTAYSLALMLPRRGSVVVTGAMRPPGVPSSDAEANLLGAFIVAASPAAAHVGPLVVLNDELHCARFVTKTHTSRLSSFASPNAGRIGEIVERRVHVWWRPAWDDYLGLPESLAGYAVESVRLGVDANDAVLRAATIEGLPSGIVVEGMGGGHVPSGMLSALDAVLAAGVPVVLATGRTGPNLQRTYHGPGSETDLMERGVIPAGSLSTNKARARLLVGLALQRAPAELFPVW